MKAFVIFLLVGSLIAAVFWLIRNAHQSWSKNPAAAWYHTGFRTRRVFGNFWFHLAAAIFYLSVAVGVPTIALYKNSTPEAAVVWLFAKHTLPVIGIEVPRLITGIVWVVLLTFSLPLFIWFERIKFDDWINTKPKLVRAKLTARFELNTKHMESFWKTVAGFYLAAGLFSFSGLGKNKPQQPTKEDVQALVTAFKHLENAALGKLTVVNPVDGSSQTPVPEGRGVSVPDLSEGDQPSSTTTSPADQKQ